MGIAPSIGRTQLSGVILFCGAYDIKLADMNGPYKKFLKTVLWSYTGTKKFMVDPKIATASVADYVTSDFPPAFISTGNADPLAIQSYEFAKKLSQLKVKVDTLFFPEDYKPALSHEYQFNLQNEAGKKSLERATDFVLSTLKHQQSRTNDHQKKK